VDFVSAGVLHHKLHV